MPKYPRPLAVFCDIDGVILFQDKGAGLSGHINSKPTMLPGVLEKFEEWEWKGYRIIITTGRRRSAKKETIRQLKSAGLFWDDILFDCASGGRVIINNRKRDSKGDTCAAINLDINTGLYKVNVEKALGIND